VSENPVLFTATPWAYQRRYRFACELAALLVNPDLGPVELATRTAVAAIYVKYIVRGPLLEVNHGKNRRNCRLP
jgi:hypothetical protein